MSVRKSLVDVLADGGVLFGVLSRTESATFSWVDVLGVKC